MKAFFKADALKMSHRLYLEHTDSVRQTHCQYRLCMFYVVSCGSKLDVWVSFRQGWLIPADLVQVKRTYSQGTYRAGAMRQVSLVGAVDEEVGDYFPEFISMLEESPFLEVSEYPCVTASDSVCPRCVLLWCNLTFLIRCLCSELCPGERSPVCACRAQQRVTTAPSCGSDLGNRWSPWQTCQNHPSKGKGVYIILAFAPHQHPQSDKSEMQWNTFIFHLHTS